MTIAEIVQQRLVRRDQPVRGIHGANERCIEVPLALDVLRLGEPGLVLDAGAAMNGHLYVATAPKAAVVHVTQAIGSERCTATGSEPVSYVSADLRNLRLFADGAFDRAVCVSTLEHVGMDNTAYFGTKESDPVSVFDAIRELRRVTRGALMASVPCGPVSWFAPSGAFRCFDWREVSTWGAEVQCFAKDEDTPTWSRVSRESLPDGSDPVRGIAVLWWA